MNFRKLLPQRFLLAVSGLLLLCAGCDPTDWICWAPDGEHAFVRGKDSTGLIDRTGKILGKATDACAWLPDSRRVIAGHKAKPTSWDEYAKLPAPDRHPQTTNAAASVLQR